MIRKAFADDWFRRFIYLLLGIGIGMWIISHA